MKILFTVVLSFLFVATQAQKTEFGKAQVYSQEFDGAKTSSNETFNSSKFTAAHNTLPYGTLVKVKNMKSGKSTIVKINDRGPFIDSYVITLSRSAAEEIKIKNNSTSVKITVHKEVEYKENSELKEALSDVGIEEKEGTEDEIPEEYDTTVKKPKPESTVKATVETPTVTKPINPKPSTTSSTSSATDNVSESVVSDMASKGGEENHDIFDLYKAATYDVKTYGYGVQVGAYDDFQNVLAKTGELHKSWFGEILLIREKGTKGIHYKIVLGAYAERTSADSYRKAVAKKGIEGFVVAVQKDDKKQIDQFKVLRPAKKDFAVQVMVLNDSANVVGEIEKLKAKWFENILVNVVQGKDGKPLYKLLLGPFPDKKTADSYKTSLTKKKMDGFVVDLSTIK
ncbi:MAG: septal ring lytic transglycosylase RlpA family protein [Saprospiraceae bacterium]